MKKAFIVTMVILMMSVSVSAWHCVDTDEDKPEAGADGRYGPWGDNAMLGGNTLGWLDYKVDAPQGCESTGDSTADCNDTCIGYTLREFYCDDRPDYNDKEYPGETVIMWNDYSDHPECQPGGEIPEFSTVGAALALLGAGFFAYRKRK